MRVLLVSTYELGRQPFGLAEPAAWLQRAGVEVRCLDLSVEPLEPTAVREAEVIALHVPMHLATRLAVTAARRMRQMNPGARLCFFGLYAPLNEPLLRAEGAAVVLGGECERELLAFALGQAPAELVPLRKLPFAVPDRSTLPPLARYAALVRGERRLVAGATEASRGCKHRCRHCPIVPVYDGRFFVVAADVVLADVDQQVAAGAEHITFGDPDFFNGPGHALAIVRALHERHPQLTYDVTIKVEHLLQHTRHLATLAETGCLFVTSAVESFDDAVLARLDKGHDAAGFRRALAACRAVGLTLCPTFVAFTPWTSLASYRAMLATVAELELIEAVAPIQLAIRLLVTPGSLLLGDADVLARIGPFDAARLMYPWEHDDPRVDALQHDLQRAVQRVEGSRADAFAAIWARAHDDLVAAPSPPAAVIRAPVPYLTEPWYC